MVRALVCGTRGRWFESTLLYQIMTKEKKNKPLRELPLGFVDRQENKLARNMTPLMIDTEADGAPDTTFAKRIKPGARRVLDFGNADDS